jgi:hypothetical protein
MSNVSTMSSEPLSRETLFKGLSELASADKWEAIEQLLTSLKGQSVKLKSKKIKDPNAPKREVKPDSFIHFMNKVVWPILDTLSQTEENAEAKARMRSTDARSQVSTAMWKSIKDREDKAEAFSEITNEQVSEAFSEWLKTAPPPKPKKVKETSDKSSDASEGSKKSKRAGKLESMTDDEKAAFYKARGAAAAAKRAANKAAKAESSADSDDEAPEPVKPVEKKPVKVKKSKSEDIEPEFGDDQKAWTNPKDGKTYIRQNDMLWDAATAEWVGLYDRKTRTIDTSAAEPTYSDDDE